MRNEKYEKFIRAGIQNSRFFRGMAEHVVREKLEGIKEPEKAIEFFASNFAMGAAAKRKSHILTGIGIGTILGSLGTLGTAYGMELYYNKKDAKGPRGKVEKPMGYEVELTSDTDGEVVYVDVESTDIKDAISKARKEYGSDYKVTNMRAI